MNLENIKYVIFDFDGVMTDNRVLIDENGKEYVYVSRADGMGIQMLKGMGIECVIMSTEKNQVVSKRGEKLKIEVIQNLEDKEKKIIEFASQKKINLKEILFIGNDINDIGAMKIVGMCATPADAYEAVKQQASMVLETKGGYGVAREIAELFMRVRG